MHPTAELVESLLRERIERARHEDPAEKMWAGPRLFSEACERMKDGIRWRHPEANEEEVMEILRQQLKLQEKLGL
jgi:hypothetical protein